MYDCASSLRVCGLCCYGCHTACAQDYSGYVLAECQQLVRTCPTTRQVLGYTLPGMEVAAIIDAMWVSGCVCVSWWVRLGVGVGVGVFICGYMCGGG